MRNRGGSVFILVAVLVLLPISAWCSLYEYDFSSQTDAEAWEYMEPGWTAADRAYPPPSAFPYDTATFSPFVSDWWYPTPLGPDPQYPGIRFPRQGTAANPGFEGYGSDFQNTTYLPFVNRQDTINFLQYHVVSAVMRADTPAWNSADGYIGFYIGVGDNRYHYLLESFKPAHPWDELTFDLQAGTESDWWQFSWDPDTETQVQFQKSFLVNPDEFGWFITADPEKAASATGDIYMGFFSADVPAPPALLLLPIGLAGAMVARRRRREQTD